MSEETPKITTILKEKDPKRVEGQLNKERKLHKEQQMEIDNNSRTVNYSLILNVIGVAVVVASLYYGSSTSATSSVVNKNKKLQVENKDPEPLQVKLLPAPLLDTLE